MKKVLGVLLILFSYFSIAFGQRTLSTDETWSGTHTESDNVIVPSGITLTISPETTVKFASEKSLKITGTGVLHAGNSDASGSVILFTADDGVSWGHIYCESTGTSWLKNCDIEKGNTSGLTSDYGSVYGGAIYAKTNSLTIEKCLIHDNEASWGGGVFIGAGVSPVLKNSEIYLNTASEGGGGLYIWQNSVIIVTNCLIYNNTCSGSTYGGGGVFVGYGTGYARIVNSVIIGNTAANVGPGIYFFNSPKFRTVNTIIWGNGSGTQIYFDASTPTSIMQYCGIQGVSYSTCLNLNSSNSDPAGPNFTDPSGNDYSILYVSPCRDAGINSYGSPNIVPTTDYSGNSRVLTTDIGAYEVQYSRWKTNLTSTDWNTGSNWDGGLPSSSRDVIIPTGASSYPTVSPGPDFTIGSGKLMIIDQGAKVTLDDLTNNGTLKLNHNASGFASLILGSYTDNGTEEIQLYLTGGYIGDPENYEGRWHYISSPVSSLAVSTFAPGTTLDLAQFVESYPQFNLLEGWVAYDGYVYSTGISNGPTFSALSPGKGYNYWDNNNNTFTFSGSFNTSNVPVSLGFSGDEDLSGFNLLGNSFSSGLNWDDITNSIYFTYPANTSKGLYFTRENTQCTYINEVGIPSDVTGIIPPMQGFFTKTYSTGNTITLPAAARTHDNIHARYKGKSLIPLVRLAVTEDTVANDETVVRFDEEAKSYLDNDFDAVKMFPSSNTAIYTSLDGTDYTINGLPFPETIVEIPVVVNLTTAGTHKISNIQLQGLDDYNVTLMDNSTGFIADLKTTPVLTFASGAGLIDDRFVLKISNVATAVEIPAEITSSFNIYHGYGLINIQTISDEWEGRSGSVKLFNMTGKSVTDTRNAEFRQNSLTRIPAPSAKGLYIVEIQSGMMRYVGKVIVK